MALVVKRTAAAGGADATVTTAAGVWGVVDALLLAAGWTVLFDYFSPAPSARATTTAYVVGNHVTNSSNVYQCITSGTSSGAGGPTTEAQSITDGTVAWRFVTSASSGAKVYTSTGESGNEKLFVRVEYNTNATAAVNMYTYQYFDASAKFGYNRFSPGAGSVHQYTYTAGNTVNYVMVANKDGFQCLTNDSANARRLFGGGRLNRGPGALATYFVSNGTVTAGTNKTFTFSSGDPVAAGYKIGDPVFVVSQQANVASPFDGTIPVYSASIVSLTTSSITINQAKETTSAGALIGADPQCQFSWTTTANSDPNTASTVFFSYRFDNTVTNLYTAATADTGYANSAGGLSFIVAAAADLDPNNRTGRVAVSEVAMLHSTNEVAGILPLFYSNPRTSDALWAIARTTQESTNYDYVTFPTNTATPAGTRRSEIGPIVVSGAAGYTVDLYHISDVWVEGVFLESNNPTDRVCGAVLVPKSFGASTVPFDSPGAVLGGTGGGFNSGVN